MRARIFFLLACLALTACGSSMPVVSAQPTPTPEGFVTKDSMFEITLAKPDDRIAVTAQDEILYLDISSPSGIGQAQIHPLADLNGKKFILRLHLRGLENFTFVFGDKSVQAAIPSTGAPMPIEALVLPSPTEPLSLTAQSEYWLPIEPVAPNKTIPLTDGYFQIELPRAYYDANARDFSIAWIDFYR